MQIDKPTHGVGPLGAAVEWGAAVTIGCRVVELAVVVRGCDGDDDEQAPRQQQTTAAMILSLITFATLIIARARVPTKRGQVRGDRDMGTSDSPRPASHSRRWGPPARLRMIEAALRDDEISGIAVHIAARGAAAAGAGEVLVLRILVDLVAGWGLGFADQWNRWYARNPGRNNG